MRLERILEIVLRQAPNGSLEGITKEEVAKLSGVMRHYASADLNELVRKGLLMKQNSRPVRFWAADTAAAASAVFSDHAPAVTEVAGTIENNSFNEVIGSQGSL